MYVEPWFISSTDFSYAWAPTIKNPSASSNYQPKYWASCTLSNTCMRLNEFKTSNTHTLLILLLYLQSVAYSSISLVIIKNSPKAKLLPNVFVASSVLNMITSPVEDEAATNSALAKIALNFRGTLSLAHSSLDFAHVVVSSFQSYEIQRRAHLHHFRFLRRLVILQF